MNIKKELFKLQDIKYAEFVIKLTPSVDSSTVIGVRVPEIRKLSKQLDQETIKVFLNELPHKYYEENLLHSILISNCKDYWIVINNLNIFLPYVDNWAVCDAIHPKIFNQYKNELLKCIKKWIKSKHTYTVRCAINLLMTYYLDDDFKITYLNLVARIKTNEYYIMMMQSWFFATALTKRWDDAIVYLKNDMLSKWVHNKTIQKTVESYRITSEQKKYLKTLRKKI